RNNLRNLMERTIRDMMDSASNEEMTGKVYVVFESIADLQWISAGDGDSKRWMKHWRLVIQLGFDWFTLEYFQDSVFSLQGLVVVGPFDPEATNAPTKYHVGDLKVNMEELSRWIQQEFDSKEEYNVITNNCQDFVHNFLAEFEDSGRLLRSGYLARPTNRHQYVAESGEKLRQLAFDGFTHWRLTTYGRLIGVATHGIKSASESNIKP
ncbi:hypothetical protein BGZ90_002857, partial [Linnemannia elongata]